MSMVTLPIKKLSYDKVLKLSFPKHQRPTHGWRLIRFIIAKLIFRELNNDNFTLTCDDSIKYPSCNEPAIFLMNHSSKTDLEIFFKMFKYKHFYNICSHDGFVGQYFFLQNIASFIPSKRYILDLQLIDDIKYVAKKYKKPIILFPEANWSYGGVESLLPESLGGMLKYFNLPVYILKTYGAHQHHPSYNNTYSLKNKFNVKVSTKIEYLFTREDLQKLRGQDIQEILNKYFTYDHYRWQYENHIKVNEPFRANGLHRVLYKCPHCKSEGKMIGKGVSIKCNNCGKEYELTEYGKLKPLGFDGCFEYISDWYKWEEEYARKEIVNNTYYGEAKVKIYVLKNWKAAYDIGMGYIKQDRGGIKITDLEGTLLYEHLHKDCYTLYVEFFTYGLGDVISVGNQDIQYYCVPKYCDFPVLKARFGAIAAYNFFKNKL